MNPAATLGTYAGALALVFVAAFGIGNLVGPVGAPASTAPASTAPASTAPAHGADHDRCPSSRPPTESEEQERP